VETAHVAIPLSGPMQATKGRAYLSRVSDITCWKASMNCGAAGETVVVVHLRLAWPESHQGSRA